MNNTVCELFIKPAHGAPAEKKASVQLLKGVGVCGDCFALGGERQVSLLLKSAADMLCEVQNSSLPCVKRFTCNIVFDSDKSISVGSVIRIGSAEIIITRSGRECHKICEQYKNSVCPLVTGCFFGEVQSGGIITEGEEIEIC